MMESQLHILFKTISFIVYVFPRVIPALILCNIFLEAGLMEKLKPVGKMFTKLAHLPPEVSLPFISSFGSSYTGGAMVISLQEKKVLSERQAILSALALSVPVFLREFFSYFLPTALSVLGWALGSFYLCLRILVIGAKVVFVILVGRKSPVQNWNQEKISKKKEKIKFKNVVRRGWKNSIKPLRRILITIPLAVFIIFELEGLGVFRYLALVAGGIGLSSEVVPVIASYIISPIMGLSMLAALYQQGNILLNGALKTMLLASLFHLPVITLRFLGTYYLGVYGLRLGIKLAAISFALSILVYIGCLFIILVI